MSILALAIYGLIAGWAILQSLLVLLQTWEHRRFARNRLNDLGIGPEATGLRVPCANHQGKVMVYAPCKGVDAELEETLDRLLDQDYPDYEVTFVVQNAWDPAYRVIRRAIAEHPRVAARIVLAGAAEDCGQKVHNLRIATAEIPAEVRYVAFIDSDAKPRRQWLRALISHLEAPNVGAATGYRWLVPAAASLASWMIYSINCNVAVLMRSRGPNLIWGGSWAMRRESFEQLAISDSLAGMLTEDLVVAEQLRRHKLRVEFEPACVVPSLLEGNARDLFSFLRRQYLLGRYYAPRWWRLGGVTLLHANVALAASLGMLGWGCAVSPPAAWTAGAVCAALYALHVARGLVRQSLVRLYCPEAAERLRAAGRFDIWAGPLVSAVSLAVVLASALGRTVTWRGITYRVLSDGSTRIVRRAAEPQVGSGRQPQAAVSLSASLSAPDAAQAPDAAVVRPYRKAA